MSQDFRYEVDTWSPLAGKWFSASLEPSETKAEAERKAAAFEAETHRSTRVMEVHPDGTRTVADDGPFRTTADVGTSR